MSFPSFTSTETEPHARGAELGARLRDAVAANLAGYTALFEAAGATGEQVRAWGERALERAAAWAPRLADEIAGLASGAGLEPWQVAVVNARTEILAALDATGPGECSTSVVLPGRGLPPRTVQTWDWLAHLRDAPVLWAYETRPGHVVRTFTEAGALAKIGANSAGLGVHFNLLRHRADGGDLGVPVHLIARRILDEAATVEEAADLARSATVSASTVITAVTADGAGAIEISPAGVAVVPPDGGVLQHCNHFLDPALAEGERLGPEEPGTYTRQRYLGDHAGRLGGDDLTARALALVSHEPEGVPVCAHPDPALPLSEQWETLATIGLDLPAGRLLVHQGGPCQVTGSTWQVF
ncbi:C45 family autoproteolytic acyltransferase/hydolase [Nonomuraea sp. NPDC048826]|uniref:C45 family autoproteolytic acyltransferase/hydolase n=1 Tax=Nonomuraea sp. NPDC048826 TaxID=3364347 RepID=UPI0037123EAA